MKIDLLHRCLLKRLARNGPTAVASGPSTTPYRLLLVFFAVIFSETASGLADGHDGRQTNLGGGDSTRYWRAERSISSDMDSMEKEFSGFGSVVIQSLHRSGLYGDVFDRICGAKPAYSSSPFHPSSSTSSAFSPSTEGAKKEKPGTRPLSGTTVDAAQKASTHSTTTAVATVRLQTGQLTDGSTTPASAAGIHHRRRHRRSVRHSSKTDATKPAPATCQKLDVNFSQPSPSKEEEDVAFFPHKNEVDEACSCNRNPGCQPVREILHLGAVCTLQADLDYEPKKTIVYRCKSSGTCCNILHTCQVKSQETIRRTFKVTRREYGSEESALVTLDFQNDTDCECRPKRCPAKCPKPYTPAKFCGCTCSGKEKRECVKIQNGKIDLEDSEKRCVENNRCRIPSCVRGLYYKDGRCQSCKEDSLET